MVIYICICFLTCTWYFSRHITSFFKVKGLKRLNQNNTPPQRKSLKKRKIQKKDKETITEKVREWRGVASDNEYLGLLHIIMYVHVYVGTSVVYNFKNNVYCIYLGILASLGLLKDIYELLVYD